MHDSMEQQEGTLSQDTGSRPWENLPDDILELVSKRLKLLDYVSFHNVCKAWRKVKPPLCFPQLVIQTIKGSRDKFPSAITSKRRRRDICPYFIIDLQDHTLHNFKLPEFEGRTFIGSSHGWLIMGRRGSPYECFLLDLFTSTRIELPPLDHTIQEPAVCLSSVPTSPECIVLVLDSSLPSFLFCKPGDVEWTVGESNYPFYSKFCEFRVRDYLDTVTTFGGKFYALSYRGKLVEIDDVIHPRTITVLPVDEVRTPYMPKLHRFIVESQGELLLVIVETGQHIDLFRLDFESMSWINIESLGDRVLFLGVNCSLSVSPSEIGTSRGNCIYFDRCKESSINYGVYDLEDNTIMFYKPHGCYRRRLQFVWVSPTFV